MLCEVWRGKCVVKVVFVYVMCGGIFKGLYFNVVDLFVDMVVCDVVLLVVMGLLDEC